MLSGDYLFTRRQFLQSSAAAVAACGLASARDASPVKVGQGKATYTLDPQWGVLPDGMRYGLGCAIVVDKNDRVIVTSRSTSPCVAIFDKTGKLLETWTKEISEKVGYSPEKIADTAHGLFLSNEGGTEFLYWTENVSTNRQGPKFGKRVYKTDMQGKILFTLGPDEKESSTTLPLPVTNPTDVAIGPNGDIYIVDGYGSQKVYRFDKNFKQLKVIGGKGKEQGQFNTCHGVWVNTLKKDPEVYIADRANNRIEVYSPELEYKRTIPGVRNPCCFYQAGGMIYIPELDQRVTILDADDKVVAHLGDGHGPDGKKMDRKDVEANPAKFFTPHALTVDSRGNMFVLEWIDFGRVRKFAPTPA
ncbi:MAG: twin-arginine translocation signal domain-containing protein [Gemmataceae bacterium]